MQDARDDAQNQQNEIAQRILQKMGPMLVKYAADNGFGVIIDTSNPWPNGPVLWAGPAVDITKPVVDLYNAQSGVRCSGCEARRSHGLPRRPRPSQHPRRQPPLNRNSFSGETLNAVKKFPQAACKRGLFSLLHHAHSWA